MLSAILFAIPLCSNVAFATQGSRFIFAMGDSYTAMGFNVSNSPQPTIETPFGNPAYPGLASFYTGVENWLQVMVSHLIPTTSGAVVYDYATGSNPVSIQIVGQAPDSVPNPIKDMRDQVAEWTAETSQIGWRNYNTLSINWFGINDINAAGLYAHKSMADTTPILDRDIEEFFNQVVVLYEFGIRKFLTINVMPLAKSPVWSVGDPSRTELAYNLSTYWNQQIAAGSANFKSNHPDAEYEIFDPWPIFDEVLDTYPDSGPVNKTCTSTDGGRPCPWHDFIHGGVRIQSALGSAVYQLITQNFTFF